MRLKQVPLPLVLSEENAEAACPGCGQTRRELYGQGRMGCALCYQTFASEVAQALKEIHGESRHLGKNSA